MTVMPFTPLFTALFGLMPTFPFPALPLPLPPLLASIFGGAPILYINQLWSDVIVWLDDDRRGHGRRLVIQPRGLWNRDPDMINYSAAALDILVGDSLLPTVETVTAQCAGDCTDGRGGVAATAATDGTAEQTTSDATN